MTWRAAFWTAATVAALALGGIYFFIAQHRVGKAMAGWWLG